MRSVTYPVRRAYAVLGLQPDASLGQVRRRYKALAKRWHPDRHVTDPLGQVEAGSRMREINAAYRLLARQIAPGNQRRRSEPSVASRAPTRERLSREEIEALVRSIGSEGPVDGLLSAFGWGGSTFEGVLTLLVVVGCVMRLAVRLLRGDLGGTLEDPDLLLILAVILVLFVVKYLERRKLEHGS